MKIYKKAILPLGFKAKGIASGIKKSGKLDLALLYSDIPAKAACQFTINKIQAAPIQLNKIHLKKSKRFQAIIVNSGNANCFTGEPGLRDAEETAKELAKALNTKKENILVASTGIIGRRLPLLKIKKAVPELVTGLSKEGINKTKIAIMTTDTFSKEITVKFNLGKRTVTICGIAKGAGMIAPNMATMLTFILTDALISQQALNKALKVCVDNSFNCITIDGCMSTNDSIMMLANGQAKNALIDNKGENFNTFTKVLQTVCAELAKMIIKDAEGATKFIRIRVDKAKSFTQARQVAKAIANSNLFKTAIYGENPNFGRIVASIGASGVDVKEKDIKIRVSPLKKKEIKVDVLLNQGDDCAIVYTSDLTPEYIRINAEYN
jgi:glutamate N-acetyltransferase/amino-acid N-acetyltransferase